VDVKALLRLAVLYNIPTVNNLSTADFIISSELSRRDYHRIKKVYIGVYHPCSLRFVEKMQVIELMQFYDFIKRLRPASEKVKPFAIKR
jgi:hypothetical protein